MGCDGIGGDAMIWDGMGWDGMSEWEWRAFPRAIASDRIPFWKKCRFALRLMTTVR